jgi:hypothetical protein
MQYKTLPRLDYHHIQPRAILPPRTSPGDLHSLTMREQRKLPPSPQPRKRKQRLRAIAITNIYAGPELAPEPVTVPTPYGPVTVDPASRSPWGEIALMMPWVALIQSVAWPRLASTLQHAIRCWINNLFGGGA